MSFEEKINADLMQAMLKKDESATRGIRLIKAAVLLAKTEKDGEKELSDESAMKILQKMMKQRKDSLEIYEREKREDLAKKEREEMEVIGRYLPEQMSAEELKMALKKILEETGATGIKDMGKVMSVASKQFAGRADGKMISAVVKELLANG